MPARVCPAPRSSPVDAIPPRRLMVSMTVCTPTLCALRHPSTTSGPRADYCSAHDCGVRDWSTSTVVQEKLAVGVASASRFRQVEVETPGQRKSGLGRGYGATRPFALKVSAVRG